MQWIQGISDNNQSSFKLTAALVLYITTCVLCTVHAISTDYTVPTSWNIPVQTWGWPMSETIVLSLSKDSCSYRETMIPLLKAKASNRVMSQHMNIILLIVHFCFIVLEHLILYLCWFYFHKNMKWHFQLRFGQNFQQPLKWSEIHFCYFVLLSYYLVKGHLLLSIFFNPQHSVIWSQTEPRTTVYKTMSCNMMTCDILSSFYIF